MASEADDWRLREMLRLDDKTHERDDPLPGLTDAELAEIEARARAATGAGIAEWSWVWREGDDVAPGAIACKDWRFGHVAVAMCPRYGRDKFEADAAHIVGMDPKTTLRLVEMAKRGGRG